jgi:hypothetical protein
MLDDEIVQQFGMAVFYLRSQDVDEAIKFLWMKQKNS